MTGEENGKPSDHAIGLSRVFDAGPDRIYAAWTEPDVMRRWIGRAVDADVRVGGRYRIENDAEEGQVYVHTGEYLVLEPGRRIVQTFLAGAGEPSPYRNEFIEIALRPVGEGRTELAFLNGWDGGGLDDEGREAVIAGWSMWLDLLEKMIEEEKDKR